MKLSEFIELKNKFGLTFLRFGAYDIDVELSKQNLKLLSDELIKCNNLKYLALGNLNIYQLEEDDLDSLSSSLKYLVNLKYINIEYDILENLSNQKINIIIENVSKCLSIEKISMGESLIYGLNNEKIHYLSLFFEKCLSIKEVNLSGVEFPNLSASIIEELGKSIGKIKNLEAIYLEQSKIGILNIEFLSALNMFFKHLPHLKMLNLRNNGFRNYDINQMTMFAQIFMKMPNLEVIDLSDNDLGYLTLMKFNILFDGVNSCKQLKSLNLSDNSLAYRGQGFLVLKKCFNALRNLRELDLSGNLLNVLSFDDVNELHNIISSSDSLEILHLNNNLLPNSVISRFEKCTQLYKRKKAIDYMVTFRLLDISKLASHSNEELIRVGLKVISNFPPEIQEYIFRLSSNHNGPILSEMELIKCETFMKPFFDLAIKRINIYRENLYRHGYENLKSQILNDIENQESRLVLWQYKRDMLNFYKLNNNNKGSKKNMLVVKDDFNSQCLAKTHQFDFSID